MWESVLFNSLCLVLHHDTLVTMLNAVTVGLVIKNLRLIRMLGLLLTLRGTLKGRCCYLCLRDKEMETEVRT